MRASFVWMCVCVPKTAETLPSRYHPIACFSLVVSACISTMMIGFFSGILAIMSSTHLKGSEAGMWFMKTRPRTVKT